jgi:putative DNA primase/helicase
MGYVLYKGMPRPSIFLPIGGPGTGKSLFLDIITELVGLVNACSVRPNKFGDPTYVAKMHNRLVNICGEINARSFEKNLDVIKDISAGGRVSARFLYQNAFEFAPICKHFFACNDFPNFIDQTHALYDRLYVIPFSKRFRDTNEEIIDYIKIIREELPAIFNWCIVGLRRLIENDFRFSVPESANASKEAFKVMHDPVHNFATTCIVQLPHHVINRRELREVFNEFVRLEYDKTQELTAMEFKAAMEARGIYTTKRGGYDVFKDVFYTDDGRLYKDGLVR